MSKKNTFTGIDVYDQLKFILFEGAVSKKSNIKTEQLKNNPKFIEEKKPKQIIIEKKENKIDILRKTYKEYWIKILNEKKEELQKYKNINEERLKELN